MKDRINQSPFAKLYVWVSKAKYTMGIFFVAFLFMYFFLGCLAEGPAFSLDVFTAIQMLFACFFIGIAQQILLPDHTLSPGRLLAWLLISLAISVSFSALFSWFEHLWQLLFFQLIPVFGILALALGYYWELRQETRMLNDQLSRFQSQVR